MVLIFFFSFYVATLPLVLLLPVAAAMSQPPKKLKTFSSFQCSAWGLFKSPRGKSLFCPPPHLYGLKILPDLHKSSWAPRAPLCHYHLTFLSLFLSTVRPIRVTLTSSHYSFSGEIFQPLD